MVDALLPGDPALAWRDAPSSPVEPPKVEVPKVVLNANAVKFLSSVYRPPVFRAQFGQRIGLSGWRARGVKPVSRAVINVPGSPLKPFYKIKKEF